MFYFSEIEEMRCSCSGEVTIAESLCIEKGVHHLIAGRQVSNDIDDFCLLA